MFAWKKLYLKNMLKGHRRLLKNFCEIYIIIYNLLVWNHFFYSQAKLRIDSKNNKLKDYLKKNYFFVNTILYKISVQNVLFPAFTSRLNLYTTIVLKC